MQSCKVSACSGKLVKQASDARSVNSSRISMLRHNLQAILAGCHYKSTNFSNQLKTKNVMKVMTISGETLRKEFTALECAALKHAAEYCTVGDVFTGVPTSSEERYRRCQQQFEVVEHDGENLTVKKCGTDRVLFAKIGGNSQKRVPQPEPEYLNSKTGQPAIPQIRCI